MQTRYHLQVKEIGRLVAVLIKNTIIKNDACFLEKENQKFAAIIFVIVGFICTNHFLLLRSVFEYV